MFSPSYHTLPCTLPHTATHCPHCRMTPAHALPDTATLPYTSTHALPRCRTSARCHKLPHTAAHLPDSRTLRRCALPYITNNTAAHCRTLVHLRTMHTNPNKFTYVHLDSHKLCVCHIISFNIYYILHLAVGNCFLPPAQRND